MRTTGTNTSARASGIMLLECLIYVGVAAIVLGLGLLALYTCWDNSKALRQNADDITRALRVGERWRADVRAATGAITVDTAPDGQLVRIPCGTNEIFYVFVGGHVSRKVEPSEEWLTMLPKVTASHMELDDRTEVKAWRWELELAPSRLRTRLKPLFTFEAVPPATP